jgi:hypothetical protein
MSLRLVYCACALLAVVAAEADVGIGVSAKSDEATAYIPITAGRFMFEPYFRSSDQAVEEESTTQHTEAHALGLGIFRVVAPAERVTFYYGGRLAHLEEELRSDLTSTGTTFRTSETEGHSIVPTIGFQYHVIERLSIGAEVGVDRREVERVITNFNIRPPSLPQIPPTVSTSKTTSTDTKAELIVRLFF